MNFMRKITNYDYYNMVENQIRSAMQLYEVGIMLSVLESFVEKFNIVVKEFPPEGYYYKTPGLKRYFNISKTLQETERTKEIDESYDYDYLNIIYPYFNDSIFGFTYSNRQKDYLLPKRVDLLTVVAQKIADKDQLNPRVWKANEIFEGIKNSQYVNIDLILLALKTEDIRCVTFAAETNNLYREIAYVTGCYPGNNQDFIWDVSKELSLLGEKLIQRYNNKLGSNIISPNIHNHFTLNKIAETPRVARIGKVEETEENYFWIVNRQGVFEERYTREDLTTNSL